ncbi:MAG: hypothetical protein R6V03_10615 [Kiritimatiellia bacterium]
MNDVAKLLNEMVNESIIRDYAVFGAMAQMRYTDAVATMDADVLVSVPEPDRLDVLTPVYDFCRRKGLKLEGETVRVGAWPVQFLPVFNELTEEALEHAEEGEIDGVKINVISADYLAVIALQTGRAKDFARIAALNESNAIDLEHIAHISERHSLSAEWRACKRKYIDAS